MKLIKPQKLASPRNANALSRRTSARPTGGKYKMKS